MRDKKKIIKKTQKLNSKLADWDDDDPQQSVEASSRWDKVVILKHMFTLDELSEDPAAILDIKEDIRGQYLSSSLPVSLFLLRFWLTTLLLGSLHIWITDSDRSPPSRMRETRPRHQRRALRQGTRRRRVGAIWQRGGGEGVREGHGWAAFLGDGGESVYRRGPGEIQEEQ